jgi:N-sulfoglucosamine sulfohydrolase
MKVLVLFIALTTYLGAFAKVDKRPNILWIISEDMSQDLACYGNSIVKTPHLDDLARKGMRFTHMFTTSAVCAPSRTALVTGMYQTSIGAMHMRYSNELKPELPSGVKTVESIFYENGYQTLGVGKDDYMFRLDGRSFQYDDIASLDPTKPFFAKVNSTFPHRVFKKDKKNPVDPRLVKLPPYYPDVDPIREDWAAYLENVQLLDEEVGAILKEFSERGLLKNTIVFFFSDHGRPFIRAKYWTYDSGIRIPFIVYVPDGVGVVEGYAAGTTNDQMISSIDITATSLALAGIAKPSHMQGKVFLGSNREEPRELVFSSIDRISGTYLKTRSVRSKKYKYIKNFNNGRSVLEATTEYAKAHYPCYSAIAILDNYNKLTGAEKTLVTPLSLEELYDLENDPEETINLAYDPAYADVRKGLEKELMSWLEEIDDKGFKPDSPEIQKHFIDTRIRDKERFREARLKSYQAVEKKLKKKGNI